MKRSEIFFSVLLVPVDFTMLMLATFTAYWLRFGPYLKAWRPVTEELSLVNFLSFALLATCTWLVIFVLAKLYVMSATHNVQDETRRLFIACTAGVAVIIIFDFARHELFVSRFIILAVWFLSFIYVAIGRGLIRSLQRHWLKRGVGVHRVVLIGSDKNSQDLKSAINKKINLGLKVVGQFADFSPAVEQAMREMRQRGEFDEILIGALQIPHEQVAGLLDFSYEQHVVLKYAADLIETQSGNIEISMISGIPVVELKKTRLEGWGRVLKRIFDLLVGTFLIIILAPLLLLIAIAVKLDSAGPTFFSYQRVGQFGRPFKYFKFRSMKPGSHQLRYDPKFLAEHQNLRAGTPMIKIKDDPRITRVGKFIRRFSLDELSELFLVFSGRMSLVGPRPHEAEEVAKYQKHHRRVLSIKPGITGLAQVSGRSDLDFDQEVKLDIYYMEHWSLFLDILILLKTPLAVFKKRKAE